MIFSSFSQKVLVALPLVLSLVSGCAAEPEFYRDIRPTHWFWNGVDPIVLTQIIDTIENGVDERAPGQFVDGSDVFAPGEWTYEFEAAGDRLAALGEEQRALGLSRAAAAYFNEAAAYYAVAKFPHFAENENQQRAYAKNIDALEAAWQLRGLTFKRIETEFDGERVDGILMLPPESHRGPVPIVLGTNGIDVLKGEFFQFAEQLVAREIGFFAFDIPGTGTHSHLTLTPDSQRLTEHFVRLLAADSRIDGERVGLIGVSFGGNAVVKLAMQEPAYLRAAVNMCGPVHSVFMLKEEEARYIDPMYLDALADRIGWDSGDFSEFVQRMRQFSLVEQGLIGGGKTTSVPVYSVNAAGDYVAPEYDLELVAESSRDSELVYSGSGDHCPQDRFSVMPEVVSWLDARLK